MSFLDVMTAYFRGEKLEAAWASSHAPSSGRKSTQTPLPPIQSTSCYRSSPDTFRNR